MQSTAVQPFSAHLGKKRNTESYHRLTTLIVISKHLLFRSICEDTFSLFFFFFFLQVS